MANLNRIKLQQPVEAILHQTGTLLQMLEKHHVTKLHQVGGELQFVLTMA